jgi:lantibiotic modifying enzyme
MENKIRIFTPNTPETYLEAAIEAARWIRGYEVKKDKGHSWKLSGGEGSSQGDSLAEAVNGNDRTLYSGAAGIGYFFVQMYEVTGDKSYLEDAVGAGEYLLDTFDVKMAEKPGIHMGVSGEGFFADLLYQKTGEARFREYAVKIGDAIYASAVKDENGLHWQDTCDYMGDGGSVVYWIYLYEQTGEARFLQYAGQGINGILSRKAYEDEQVIYWNLADMHDYFDSIPAGGIIPNFAHGTSGIVYILTRYYEACNDEKYLNYAKKGVQFLKNIAITEGNSTIIPYIYYKDKNKSLDLMYLSLCHGPVGTGVMARELYAATADDSYTELFDSLCNSLIKADVAHRRSQGYWNDCVCCGASGVLLHFVNGYRLTGNDYYRAYARQVADKLIGDSYSDDRGKRWYNAWTRVMPWNVDAHHGLYIGSAGCASALLSLYAALESKNITPIIEFK